MSSKPVTGANARTSQEHCIDLPGETVRCWRSTDHIKVILRKHRDVFFDINIKAGGTYTVESKSDYYSPRDKKLLRMASFGDGEQFHLWVGRNFKGQLILRSDKNIIGTFELRKLDENEYSTDPKVKPEPLLVIIGKKDLPLSFVCKMSDPYGISVAPEIFKPEFDKKLAALKNFGTVFDYQITPEAPEIREYVAIAEAASNQIQPSVLKELNSGVAVEGKVKEIFFQPKPDQHESDLYDAMRIAANYISGNTLLNNNGVKETAGYLQENWRELDKVAMTVRIEKRVTGKYGVLFKGKPLTKIAAQMLGAAGRANIMHQRADLGSAKTAFLDGGYARSGRDGYGGTKRILMTAAKDFRGGLKIQVIGTVIDIIGDANTVYFDDKGSRDL